MIDIDDLTLVVSNILNGKSYSHCRLCLQKLNEYVRFEDLVSLDSGNNFQFLSTILTNLFGAQVCDEIPGLDAVCSDCVHLALQSRMFFDNYHKSTYYLNKISGRLLNSLDKESEGLSVNHNLYIIVNENESRIVPILNDSLKKRKGNIKQKQFACSHCDSIFDCINDLKDHNMTLHNKMICTNCYETLSDEVQLAGHTCHQERHKCTECNQYRTTVEALNKHKDRSHNIHICRECGKSCRGLDKLELHESKHYSKSNCPNCGKSYYTRDFFLKHVKLCSEGLLDPHPIRSKFEKPFVCEKCGKGYSTPGGLRVHDRFEHGDAKPHICNHCGKKFTAPSYLKTHMVKHTGEKNFKCDLCGNKFVSKEALLYHTRRHTGDKPYFCKLCDERFVNASARAEHMRFKHIGPQLSCTYCSKKFVTTHFLKQHMARHHDPTSKLYCGRLPPDLTDSHNLMFNLENED